jgi:hypothetical protein
VEGRRLVSVVNGSMKFSASIVQTNASMFIMVGARGRARGVTLTRIIGAQRGRRGRWRVSVGFEWM